MMGRTTEYNKIKSTPTDSELTNTIEQTRVQVSESVSDFPPGFRFDKIIIILVDRKHTGYSDTPSPRNTTDNARRVGQNGY